MKTRLITLLVLGALPHGHAHASPQISQIGKYYTASIDGSLRGYKVYTPKGYNSKASWKYEVVFLLHGDDTNPDILAGTMSKFIEKAEAEKFILVLPQAMYNSAGDALNPSAKPMNPQKPGEGLFTWQEIDNKIGGLSWSLKDDAQDDHELSYLKRLHSLVSSNFNVDPDRFYLVGHSRGAILTQYAAMKLNAEFAAFASIAGPGAREVGSGSKKIKLASWRPGFRVPILLMNGTDDLHVPYVGPLPKELARFDNPVVTFANWIGVNSRDKSDANSLFLVIDTVTETPNRWVGQYRFCNDGVNFYVIHGGGHHWHMPNGFSWRPQLPPETLCQDINTTDAVWNFFKNRRKSNNGSIPRPD